jgi:hypothetical protein
VRAHVSPQLTVFAEGFLTAWFLTPTQTWEERAQQQQQSTHTRAYTHTHTHVHTHTRAYTHTCIHAHTRAYTHTRIQSYVRHGNSRDTGRDTGACSNATTTHTYKHTNIHSCMPIKNTHSLTHIQHTQTPTDRVSISSEVLRAGEDVVQR